MINNCSSSRLRSVAPGRVSTTTGARGAFGRHDASKKLKRLIALYRTSPEQDQATVLQEQAGD